MPEVARRSAVTRHDFAPGFPIGESRPAYDEELEHA